MVRSDSDVERIELSTGLGVYAPAPRLLGVVRTQTSTLHWMREVDFARKPLALEWNVEAQMFRVGRVVDQAPVEHLLALDLAAWKPKVFQIINGPSLTERPLGIVWTQIDGTDGRVFLRWPMASSPGSPSESNQESIRMEQTSRALHQERWARRRETRQGMVFIPRQTRHQAKHHTSRAP